MKLRVSIIFLLTCLLARATDVIYSVQNFSLVPANVRSIEVYPLTPGVFGTNIISADRIVLTTDSVGRATNIDVVMPGCYKVVFRGVYTDRVFTNCFDADVLTNSQVYAADYVVGAVYMVTGSAYLKAESEARYLNISSSNTLRGADTNFFVQNSNLLAQAVSGGGGGSGDSTNALNTVMTNQFAIEVSTNAALQAQISSNVLNLAAVSNGVPFLTKTNTFTGINTFSRFRTDAITNSSGGPVLLSPAGGGTTLFDGIGNAMINGDDTTLSLYVGNVQLFFGTDEHVTLLSPVGGYTLAVDDVGTTSSGPVFSQGTNLSTSVASNAANVATKLNTTNPVAIVTGTAQFQTVLTNSGKGIGLMIDSDTTPGLSLVGGDWIAGTGSRFSGSGSGLTAIPPTALTTGTFSGAFTFQPSASNNVKFSTAGLSGSNGVGSWSLAGGTLTARGAAITPTNGNGSYASRSTAMTINAGTNLYDRGLAIHGWPNLNTNFANYPYGTYSLLDIENHSTNGQPSARFLRLFTNWEGVRDQAVYFDDGAHLNMRTSIILSGGGYLNSIVNGSEETFILPATSDAAMLSVWADTIGCIQTRAANVANSWLYSGVDRSSNRVWEVGEFGQMLWGTNNSRAGLDTRLKREGAGWLSLDNSTNANTGKLSLSNLVATGVVQAKSLTLSSNGTAALPSISWTDDPTTGIYKSSGTGLDFSIGGDARIRMNYNGIYVLGQNINMSSDGLLGWEAGTAGSWYKDAAFKRMSAGFIGTTNIVDGGRASIELKGIATYSTNMTMTVASTGATNTTGINQTAWLTAATSLSLFDHRGTNIFSGQTISALTPVTLQPNGYFTGTSITSVGTHAF